MPDVQLLDHRGQPIRRKELTREIAEPRLTGVRNPWHAGIAGNLSPDRLANILDGAAQGEAHDFLTLAEEMEEREPHYGSVLGTRKRAISGLDVTVEAATDEGQDVRLADEVRELIRQPEFGEMLDASLDALGKGYSAVEILWEHSASQWRPADYEWRDPRFFQWDRATGRELRLIDEAGGIDGLPLPPYKFIQHRPRLKTGLPVRGGLARLAAVTYMAKSYTVSDWLAFAEVFGMPIRVGRYGAGATKADIDKLVTAVANIGTDAAAVLPESMRLEFVEGVRGVSGGNVVYQNLAEWLDKQTSKAVLGQTMTADDGSSQSQANVHNDVRIDILKADAKALQNTLNRDLVRPFIDLNFGPQDNYPRLLLPVPEPEDLQLLVTALEKLVPVGLRVEQSVIRDKLGLPDPADDAELLAVPQAAPPAEAQPTAANRAQPAPASAGDAIDDLVDVALEEWDAQLAPVIDPIRQLANESQDEAEFLARLPELLADTPPEKLIETLAKQAFKARVSGESEA